MSDFVFAHWLVFINSQRRYLCPLLLCFRPTTSNTDNNVQISPGGIYVLTNSGWWFDVCEVSSHLSQCERRDLSSLVVKWGWRLFAVNSLSDIVVTLTHWETNVSVTSSCFWLHSIGVKVVFRAGQNRFPDSHTHFVVDLLHFAISF